MSERPGVWKVRKGCNPQRFKVWNYEEFQVPKHSESLKYGESVLPKDPNSESTKSFNVRKTRTLKVRRVCNPQRVEVWRAKSLNVRKVRGLESTKSLQPPKNGSHKVRRILKSERLGVWKVRSVCNPKRFEVWMYEAFECPKDSETLKYGTSVLPNDSKPQSTKSLQLRKTWSLKVRRVCNPKH